MEKIQLTEQSLHKIIKESVVRVINEISKDTKFSAYRKMLNRLGDMRSNGGYTPTEIEHMHNRAKNMKRAYDSDRYKAMGSPEKDVTRQAKFDRDERDAIEGNRTYGDHYSNGKRMWRTMPKE
jgi:hypothetical protein